MNLYPASKFTYEELTDAYNETRVDYLVPMPMNVARLMEYCRVYDVSLEHSCVAVEEETVLGLGMLGVRQGRGWITRLGVLPAGRRKGTGTALMTGLVDAAERDNLDTIWLEVIKGNEPAHQLFHKFGFTETRELIVARRAPKTVLDESIFDKIKRITTLNHEDAIILLAHREERPNWLNETESQQNVRNLSALLVELKNGGRGWVTYHAGLLQLTRLIVEVTVGNPTEVAEAVLTVLHQRHKRQDAIAENLCEDEKWLGFQKVGYFDSFRRIEMKRPL
ncbi:MAG: GNAT family N-acetyltransferase [Ardenticatenaceae bacterium]|nr:GNAT family N-acetyltransferase [Anaerolineales bacterium]MCB8941438.1 GNAT family N-acetyltransferase [Ardenticatenaceae bacterium]MCB8972794.1 GNAT family N-acetyltransferase [Ardenticatenaceae bacterium]